MIHETHAKTLLSSHTKPDTWFKCKYTMNIYRGCEHQCIYCDSRSECYQIENFEDVIVKINAIELLKKELKSKRMKGIICFGAMSDPYTPIEAKYKLTRQALEIIAESRFPIHLMTKSDMVLRDLDLIKKISEEHAAITFTITTADDALAKIVEPGAPSSTRRFKAIKELADNGIYTGVTLMPVLPFIEDNSENITKIVEKAHQAGASYIIAAFGMTLRDRNRDYYYKKLDEHFPGLKKKYMDKFGFSYGISAPNAKELKDLFYKLCKKYGIETSIKDYKLRKNTEQMELIS